MYLHDHMKQANKIKKALEYDPLFYAVTKESNNKIHDYNITYFMGKEPTLH